MPSRVLDGYDRERGVDILHYDLEIELPSAPGPVAARARILAERTEAQLESLALDFVGLEVDEVRVDGAEPRWRREERALVIEMAPAPAGSRHEIEVRYHGTPRDGLVLRPNRHGEFAVFADNWPDRARHWFPSIDHPSDKATVSFEVIAPAAWRVIANGYLAGRVVLADGRARTRWVETAEIPTYTMVIGAAPFAVARGGRGAAVEVSHWTFPQDSAAGAKAFSRSTEILGFYDSLFGPFPYEKLAHVQSSTRYGGMENSSAIFYSERAIGELAGAETDARGGLDELVAHETVHQWFGDAVTEKDWHHLWLSEGFAEYFAVVFFEFHGSGHGAGPGELARIMKLLRDEVVAWDRDVGLAVIDPRVAASGDFTELLHTGNYEKGAWVLHMLRREIGDEAFFDGIRAYYGALRDGTAWSADFERVMEEASGQDLGWFFAQWLARPGHPVLTVSTELHAGTTRIVVRQVQPGDPWRIAVDLDVARGGGRRRERIEMRGREAMIEVEAAEPIEITVDPDVWLLHERTR